MMAKKNRFHPGYSTSFVPHHESEGSDSSGRFDSTEDFSAPMRKWIDLNSASKDGFSVPVQTIPLSKLSSFERKNLGLRLTSELEQIKFLLNKVDLQKKRTINAVAMSSSNDVPISPVIKQKGSHFGGIRKYSELGSVPGKKVRGQNRGVTGKFESSGSNPYSGLLKKCEGVLKQLMSHQHAWVFNTPVDVVGLNLPDYYDIIKTPMDLGTIQKNLSSGKYRNPLEFLSDVRLTFTNAKTYNPPGSDVHLMADTMSRFFESKCKIIEKKLPLNVPEKLREKSGNLKGAETAKPTTHSKKRKLSPTLQEAKQEPAKRKMTAEEKHRISNELEELMGDFPDPLINFLREHCSNGGDGAEDEIEIDIDDLSDDVLFTLRKLLDDHLQEKKKNLKSEACEIELPNSGISNSSLQVDRGNDAVDEDVDIEGNETPATSYVPSVIDKDTRGKAEECTEAGPDSDGGSEGSKGSSAIKHGQVDVDHTMDSHENAEIDEMAHGHASFSGLDQLEQDSKLKSCMTDTDSQLDGETAHGDRQVSPDKMYRAAILKKRFLDTILKAREKTLTQDDKGDPEKVRREREELEMQKRREKARLQAEAEAAEDARKRAEAEAAAEAKKKRDLEREAAREALLKMEKTVEIENPRFLEDLEMLRGGVPAEQLPSSVDETSPEHNSQDVFGSFKFGEGSNPLEQLGLYMKEEEEDDEEEAEPPNVEHGVDDVEEGEI